MDLTKLTGKLLELAKIADEKTGKPNGKYLEDDKEISLFLNEAEKSVQKGEITVDDVNAIFGFEKMGSSQKAAPASDKETQIMMNYVQNLSQEEKENVTYRTRITSDDQYTKMAHDLDTMLIANGMTGAENVLNKMPEYNFTKLIEKYISKQEKYNEIDNKVENWYRNPELGEAEEKLQTLMEETIQQVLGMTYEEYKSTYAEELEAVSIIPPVLRGYSTMAEIRAHDEAVSKLSDSAKKVYRQVKDLNTYLYQNFRSWEKDIIYKGSEKTQEMGTEVILSMADVESNESAFILDGEVYGFEMPENWLVKKIFLNEINAVSAIDEVTTDTVKKPKTEKVIINGEILIEKTYSDETKEYYDLQGRKRTL